MKDPQAATVEHHHHSPHSKNMSMRMPNILRGSMLDQHAGGGRWMEEMRCVSGGSCRCPASVPEEDNLAQSPDDDALLLTVTRTEGEKNSTAHNGKLNAPVNRKLPVETEI